MFINENKSTFDFASLVSPFGRSFEADLSNCTEAADSEVSLNIPAGTTLSINVAPDLATKGELTKEIEDTEDGTVKEDPFRMSAYGAPGEPDDQLANDKDEKDAVSTRYVTLDDLM